MGDAALVVIVGGIALILSVWFTDSVFSGAEKAFRERSACTRDAEVCQP